MPSTVRGWRIAVAVGTVGITAVAVGLFAAAHRRALSETFRGQGIAFAVAFAAAAEEWLASGDREALQRAARLMLLGSVLYVQAFSADALQVDERRGSLERAELAPVSAARIPQAGYSRVAQGPRLLDVVVPLLAGGPGYVRVGLDTGSLAAGTRNGVLAAAGIGIGLDLVVIALLFLRTGRRAHPASVGSEAGEKAIRIGDLAIEEDRKRVTLAGKLVPLPPKQYALLRLLASEPGRVFSDREILAAVWPDSRYANSKDVKQHIYLLRRRLGKVQPGAEGAIVNVPGFGYRLEPPPGDH